MCRKKRYVNAKVSFVFVENTYRYGTGTPERRAVNNAIVSVASNYRMLTPPRCQTDTCQGKAIEENKAGTSETIVRKVGFRRLTGVAFRGSLGLPADACQKKDPPLELAHL